MNSGFVAIMFAPGYWGALERFQRFYRETYEFDKTTHFALTGAGNHFRKAMLLTQVAREHSEKLEEDKAELEERGFSSARRSRELAALIESVLLSLYSSIDCARQVVTHIYKKHRGVKQRTRRFFADIRADKVAHTVPLKIRDAFARAHWYPRFREIRDALVHSDLGTCHWNEESEAVGYMHSGLGSGNRALVIEDIFGDVDQLVEYINQFLGQIFDYLNSTLDDKEVLQHCGIFEGRMYTRFVRPSEAVDFGSGRCDAFRWFEKDENPTCPDIATCAAYQRREYGDGEE